MKEVSCWKSKVTGWKFGKKMMDTGKLRSLSLDGNLGVLNGVVELYSGAEDGQPSAFLEAFLGSIYVTGNGTWMFFEINI